MTQLEDITAAVEAELAQATTGTRLARHDRWRPLGLTRTSNAAMAAERKSDWAIDAAAVDAQLRAVEHAPSEQRCNLAPAHPSLSSIPTPRARTSS